MSKYVCTSKTNTEIKLVCVYEDKKLIEMKAAPCFRQTQLAFIINNELWDEDKIIAYKGINITIEKIDVTFDDFWIKYGKKVDKQQAIKEWNKLKDFEQSEAYQGINPYNKFCEKDGRSRKDPCRYLSNKCWLNEY